MKNSQVYLADTGVSIRYSVSRSTIWRWLKEGKFPKPIRLGEGSTRWRLSDLEDWEKSKEVEGVSK